LLTMAPGGQVRLMLWKNFLLRRRRPCATALELILPLVLFLLLVFVRGRFDECCVEIRGPFDFEPLPIQPFIDVYSLVPGFGDADLDLGLQTGPKYLGRPWVCNQGVEVTMAINWTSDALAEANQTWLAEKWLTLDPQEVDDWATELHETVKSWNSSVTGPDGWMNWSLPKVNADGTWDSSILNDAEEQILNWHDVEWPEIEADVQWWEDKIEEWDSKNISIRAESAIKDFQKTEIGEWFDEQVAKPTDEEVHDFVVEWITKVQKEVRGEATADRYIDDATEWIRENGGDSLADSFNETARHVVDWVEDYGGEDTLRQWLLYSAHFMGNQAEAADWLLGKKNEYDDKDLEKELEKEQKTYEDDLNELWKEFRDWVRDVDAEEFANNVTRWRHEYLTGDWDATDLQKLLDEHTDWWYNSTLRLDLLDYNLTQEVERVWGDFRDYNVSEALDKGKERYTKIRDRLMGWMDDFIDFLGESGYAGVEDPTVDLAAEGAGNLTGWVRLGNRTEHGNWSDVDWRRLVRVVQDALTSSQKELRSVDPYNLSRADLERVYRVIFSDLLGETCDLCDGTATKLTEAFCVVENSLANDTCAWDGIQGIRVARELNETAKTLRDLQEECEKNSDCDKIICHGTGECFRGSDEVVEDASAEVISYVRRCAGSEKELQKMMVSTLNGKRDDEDDDDDDDDSPGTNSDATSQLLDLIADRKLLISPKGPATDEMFAHMNVEIVNSALPVKRVPKCPFIRGLLALGLDMALRTQTLFFDSEAQLASFARDNPNDAAMGIAFHSLDQDKDVWRPDGEDFDYAIRPLPLFLPSTNEDLDLRNTARFGGPRLTSYPYYALGFLYVQELVDRAALRHMAVAKQANRTANSSTIEVVRDRAMAANLLNEQFMERNVDLQQYPYPAFMLDRFINVISGSLPLFLVLSWIYSVSLLTREMVYEKEHRLREVLRIHGLSTRNYWLGWLCTGMLQLGVTSLGLTMIVIWGRVFGHSAFLPVLLFFLLFSFCTVCFACMMSAFFCRAKVAASAAGVAYFVAYIPYSVTAQFEHMMTFSQKLMSCLLGPTAMSTGARIIGFLELEGTGLQWSNIASPVATTKTGGNNDNSFSFGHILMMLFVDGLLYLTIAWYIEKVKPGQFGVPEPWYFPFLKSFWFPERAEVLEADVEAQANASLEYYEPAPAESQVFARVKGVKKVYPNGKVALRGVSFDMHMDSITGFLGHNGAGKSTTMSILTGILAPSQGSVEIAQTDKKLRTPVGVCMQSNALYEILTVEEHLSMFLRLKGVPEAQLQSEIDQALDAMNLTPKRHAPTTALSGGMKRKLSIGIALGGGSQLVVLDEPTAGVDAKSRREIWTLLSEQRKNRAILLSTHFMDEAELLSDRIAFIAAGELTAMGTAIKLKRHFTEGYTLKVSVDSARVRTAAAAVLAAVQAVIPTAVAGRQLGSEFHYLLKESERPSFATLFRSLDNPEVRASCGIEAYGVEAATMEDVFLRASSIKEPCGYNVDQALVDEKQVATSDAASTASGTRPSTAEDKKKSEGGSSPTPSQAGTPEDASSDHAMSAVNDVGSNKEIATDYPVVPGTDAASSASSPKPDTKPVVAAAFADDTKPAVLGSGPVPLVTGSRRTMNRFCAQMVKKWHTLRRDKRAWVSQVMLPAILVAMALAIAAVWFSMINDDAPPLHLTSAMHARHPQYRQDIPFWAAREEDAVKFQPALEAGGLSSDRVLPVPDTYFDMRGYLLGQLKELMDTSFTALSVAEDGDVTVWFKNRALHAMPIALNTWTNMRAQMIAPDLPRIEVTHHPLPRGEQLALNDSTSAELLMANVTVAIVLILAMAFIPASFTVNVVHERVTKSKHLQLVAGVTPISYWLSTYVWDMVNFLIPTFVCACLFEIFAVEAFTLGSSAATLVLLVLYGAAMTPAMYAVSQGFSVPSNAYVVLVCLNVFTGTVSTLAVSTLEMYKSEVPDLEIWYDILSVVCPWLLPNYCLGRGLIVIATTHFTNRICNEFGVCEPTNAFDYDNAGKLFLTLMVVAPVMFGINMLVEYKGFYETFRLLLGGTSKVADLSRDDPQDADVTREAERVKNGETLVLNDLHKSFPMKKKKPFHAVRGLSVGVPKGECFGLLGVNGAGKTTTMRMITGDIPVSSGDCQVAGHSVRTHLDKVRANLGYCPQFDALPDKLTGREVLVLYCHLRGVHPSAIKDICTRAIDQFGVQKHADHCIDTYSGGTKRKLSAAVAMVGKPEVVLLDEPTTGIDVGARRFLWDVINNLRQGGQSIILTSHYLEECEYLCGKIGIMVAGQFRCMGTTTHLKVKFGGGYTLTVRAEGDEAAKVSDAIATQLPEAQLDRAHLGRMLYKLPATAPIANVFDVMEMIRVECSTVDYDVTQTTLEDVFLRLAEEAENGPEVALRDDETVPSQPLAVTDVDEHES